MLLPAGELAPLLRRQRLDKRRRVVRHGGTDQVRVPGKPGATGGQGHQFHHRTGHFPVRFPAGTHLKDEAENPLDHQHG